MSAFAFDYTDVERWVQIDRMDAVTIETMGRVVFTTFDTDPACFSGSVVGDASFDEVADGAARLMPKLWAAAGAELRARRRPGTTSCLVVCVAPLGTRSLIAPFAWRLDGALLSAPHFEGPIGDTDRRVITEGVALPIAVSPGSRRLAGALRLFATGRVARDVAFEISVDVTAGEEVQLTLARDPSDPDALIVRRT